MADTLTPALNSISLQPWQSGGSGLPSMMPAFKPDTAAAPAAPAAKPTPDMPAAPTTASMVKQATAGLPFPALMGQSAASSPAAASLRADEKALLDADQRAADLAKQGGATAADVERQKAEVDKINAKAIWDRQAQYEKEVNAMDLGPFKPNQDELAQMAGLFTLVGMMGAFLGGKGGVQAAANAQGALSGIMKGWSDGNDAEVARQLEVYKTNSAYLHDKIDKMKDSFNTFKDNVTKIGAPGAAAEHARDLLTNSEAENMNITAQNSYQDKVAKMAEDHYKIDAGIYEREQTAMLGFQSHMDLAAMQFGMRMGSTGAGAGLTPEAEQGLVGEYGRGGAKALAVISARYGMAERDRILNMYYQQNPGGSPTVAADVVATDKLALGNAVKQKAAAIGFEHTMQQNMDIALSLANDIPQASWDIINKWARGGKLALGDVKMSEYNTALIEVLDQFAKIASGSTTGAGATEGYREQAQNTLREGYTKGQLKGAFSIMTAGAANRKAGYDAQVMGLQRDMMQAGQPGYLPGAAAQSDPNATYYQALEYANAHPEDPDSVEIGRRARMRLGLN